MIFLDMIAAFAVAAMSGMGIGGGGLLVIYLTLVREAAQVEAQGINLLFFLFASAASLFVHFKKRTFNLSVIAVAVVTGTAGAIAGAVTANAIDPSVVRTLFGAFLTVSGLIVFFRKERKKQPSGDKIHTTHIDKSAKM